MAATHDRTSGFTFDAMPIDQRDANAGVIRCDPGAAVWFPGKEGAPRSKIDNRRWKRSRARPFLVAIHREIEPVWAREKGNRTHQLADGYDSAAMEYFLHSRQSVPSDEGAQPRARLAAPMAKAIFH